MFRPQPQILHLQPFTTTVHVPSVATNSSPPALHHNCPCSVCSHKLFTSSSSPQLSMFRPQPQILHLQPFTTTVHVPSVATYSSRSFLQQNLSISFPCQSAIHLYSADVQTRYKLTAQRLSLSFYFFPPCLIHRTLSSPSHRHRHCHCHSLSLSLLQR